MLQKGYLGEGVVMAGLTSVLPVSMGWGSLACVKMKFNQSWMRIKDMKCVKDMLLSNNSMLS